MGQYSAESFIAQGQAAAAELKKKQQQQKQQQQKQQEYTPPKLPTTQTVLPPISTPFQTTPLDGLSNWDYRTAQTDMTGKPLEPRYLGAIKLQPKQFDPNGNPYFGPGPSGWLKKWAYKLSEDYATSTEADDAWKKYTESSTAFMENIKSGFTDQPKTEEEKTQRAKQSIVGIIAVGDFFDATQKSAESSDNQFVQSWLSPILRYTNAVVGMTLEAFQVPAQLVKRGAGAQRAQREYATEAGSILPDLTIDADFVSANLEANRPIYATSDGRIQAHSEAFDFGTRLFNPLLQGYDALRFWTAPGTVKEKTDALKLGWTEGQMLYTSLVQPTVREEYLQRLQAGEDADLLAMELQNPWIEAVGEMILDPLIVIGGFGKAKKAASTIEEAAQTVRKGGLLTDPAFVEKVGKIAHSTDGQAAAILSDLSDDIIKASSRTEMQLKAAQSWKMADLTVTGNKFKYRRVVSNTLNNAVQAIKNTGGSNDDVMDYVMALTKLASDDKVEVQKALAYISHSPLPMLSFNEASMQTGRLLNNILKDDTFLRAMKETGGDWKKVSQLLDSKIDDALDYAFPSVTEMSKAFDKAKELGGAADPTTKRLADAYQALKKEHPGVVTWQKSGAVLNDVLSPLSGFLANNYFSLSYGYATRNFIQNMFTLWVDGGIDFAKGAVNFTADGVKTPKLDDFLIKQFGGIPVSLKGKTQLQSITEKSLVNRFFNWLNDKPYSPAALADAAEVYAGKMIFVKNYQKTMNSVLKLGGALPDVATWNKAGFTTEQANDFVNLLKAADYNSADAVKLFNTKYGAGWVDKWRQLDWVDPKVQKGLEEYQDYWQQINRAVATGSQEDVLKLIDNLKLEVKQRSVRAASSPATMDTSNPAWRDIANVKEQAGKYISEGEVNKMVSLENAWDRASAELNKALQTAANKLPPEQMQLQKDILNFAGDIPLELKRTNIRIQAEEMRQWTVDTVRSRENPNLLWDEKILGKKPPKVTREMLVSTVWKNFFKRKSELYHGAQDDFIREGLKFAEETGLTDLFSKAMKAILELNQYRDYVYTSKGIFTKPPKLIPSKLGETANANNLRTLANTYGEIAPYVSKQGTTPDSYLLTVINKYGDVQYARLEDVPLDIAEKAFAKHKGHEYKGFFKKADDTFEPKPVNEGLPVPPPRDPNTSPLAHAYIENKQGMLDALEHISKGISDRSGMKVPAGADMDAFRTITASMEERLAFARSQAQIVADKYRDFALLPYGETRNFDFALSLIYPYQFWYSRSYNNWMKRAFMTNPEVISRYANLKEALATSQKDLPDWWKSQIDITKPLEWAGIETDHPVYLNLEATVWPLYGLTGVDFNDPTKRTNWFTAMLDDMGKFGPTMYAPIQWAVAAYYYMDGEKDIAAKWAGRALPVTATLKSLSSLVGQPIELDPAVQIFSGQGLMDFGASDPYEEGRVSRALAAMEAEGVPEWQLIEAARTQSGPLWEEARRRAVLDRAGGQLVSYFGGVGFKGRSESDIEIDRFYGDYFRLQNLNDAGYLTSEQYQQSFNVLRERYPFMDTLLLSRRSGENRESAYAYNVIGRLPPGSSTEIYKLAGIDPETAQKFYDAGGKFGDMSETEKARFMAAMVDIGTTFNIPSNASREEWTAVRTLYKSIDPQLQQQFGEDILDKIDMFYSIEDRKLANLYMDANPEVGQAMDLRTQMIASNPVLNQYYGGIDTIERHYTNVMYDALEKKYGEEIFDLESVYYELLTTKEKNQFKKQYPQLVSYFDDKKKMKEQNFQELVRFGELLPSRPDLIGNTPENPTQQALTNFASPAPKITFDQWSQIIGEPMTNIVVDYYQNGVDIPYVAQQRLDRLAEDYGYDNGDDLLRDILVSLQ